MANTVSGFRVEKEDGQKCPIEIIWSRMFSHTVEYALRAVAALAEDWERPHAVQKIAERTKMPNDYLAKVMQALCRAGVVNAIRGRHGGYQLTQSPEKLTLLMVINAVDPIKRIDHCPLGLPGHGPNLCPLHRRLDDAIRETENAFRFTSLAELLDSTGPVRPLCPVDQPTAFINVAH
jgi:Rrf2 family nitric oxide-sensitive transcriptional repressor